MKYDTLPYGIYSNRDEGSYGVPPKLDSVAVPIRLCAAECIIQVINKSRCLEPEITPPVQKCMPGPKSRPRTVNEAKWEHNQDHPRKVTAQGKQARLIFKLPAEHQAGVVPGTYTVRRKSQSEDSGILKNGGPRAAPEHQTHPLCK